MKREIKFRAWDGRQNVMLDWQELCREIPSVIFSVNSANELMQYTGFKDDNGKEIYEGDILIITKDWPSFGRRTGEFVTVEWFGYFYACKDKLETIWPLDDTKGVEISGNIYENPELLK